MATTARATSNANALSFRASFASPADIRGASKPPKAKMRSRTASVHCGSATALGPEHISGDQGQAPPHQKSQGQEFRDREDVDRPRGLFHPDQIDGGDDDENGHDHRRPARARARRGEDLREIACEHVQVRGRRQKAGPKRQPAGLEAHMPAERFAGVQVGASTVFEPAGHFGETQDDGQHAERRDQMGQRAPRPGEGGDLRGHAEDRAADHPVHDGEGEIGARNGADRPRSAHRRHVSQCDRCRDRIGESRV